MADAVKKTKAPAKSSATKSAKKAPAAKKESVAEKKPAASKKTSEKESKAKPSHHEIAHLAQKYWAERGHRDGHAEEDWARAEQELNERDS